MTLDRRGFLLTTAAATTAAALAPDAAADAKPRPSKAPPLGGGGTPTPPDNLAELARTHANGSPISCRGGAWPTSSDTLSDVVFPSGLEADDLSGGRGSNQAHFLAPKGALKRGDSIVFRPRHAGDAVDYFGSLVAVRGGPVVRVWPSLRQTGDATFVTPPR